MVLFCQPRYGFLAEQYHKRYCSAKNLATPLRRTRERPLNTRHLTHQEHTETLCGRVRGCQRIGFFVELFEIPSSDKLVAHTRSGGAAVAWHESKEGGGAA